MPDEEFCKKYVYRALFAVLFAAIVYLFFKYVFALFLPFLIALCIAFAVRPAKLYLHRKIGMPKKGAAALSVTFLLGAVIFAVAGLFRRMMSELASIYAYLSSETDLYARLFESATTLYERIANILPVDGLHLPQLSPPEKLSNLFGEILPLATSAIASLLGTFARSIPYAFVFLAITVVASFYFAVDLEKITDFFSSILSGKLKVTLSETKSKLFSTAVKYIKAYLFIILITFTELYIGFSIMRLPYVFSLSLLISFIDILPILGTGTVLLPWAVIAFASGDSAMGAGVLTLYIVIAVIRQFIEPKIIGHSIGLYPPLTLIGMYVGVKLFGMAGLFLMPMAIIAAKNVWEAANKEVKE